MSGGPFTHKLTPRRKKIAEMFREVDSANPGKSDEWIMAIVCADFFQETGHEINNADICEAIVAQGERDGTVKKVGA